MSKKEKWKVFHPLVQSSNGQNSQGEAGREPELHLGFPHVRRGPSTGPPSDDIPDTSTGIGNTAPRTPIGFPKKKKGCWHCK